MPENERLELLEANPFTKLTDLLADCPPAAGLRPLPLHLGDPQHQPPALLADTIALHADRWNEYPPIAGTPALRTAAAAWLTRRYRLASDMIDPMRHLLTLCGTKEGLFLATQVAVPERKAGKVPVVLFPNPFYQAYIGAAVMSGAEAIPLHTSSETGYLPDLDAVPPAVLERTSVVFLCTPGNPQGAIASLDYLKHALRLAREYDFVLAVDECYSEIYADVPPAGALEAAAALGGGLDHLLVFHSLSKRSSAAGLRAGLVAGDERLLARLLRLRAYAAPQMPLPIQAAAMALWGDEAHVEANRQLYRAKFDVADRIIGHRFGYVRPDGGFFLWLDVGDGVGMTRRLWREAAVRVLPGAYLAAPDGAGRNQAERYIRVALVHDDATVEEALTRMLGVL